MATANVESKRQRKSRVQEQYCFEQIWARRDESLKNIFPNTDRTGKKKVQWLAFKQWCQDLAEEGDPSAKVIVEMIKTWNLKGSWQTQMFQWRAAYEKKQKMKRVRNQDTEPEADSSDEEPEEPSNKRRCVIKKPVPNIIDLSTSKFKMPNEMEQLKAQNATLSSLLEAQNTAMTNILKAMEDLQSQKDKLSGDMQQIKEQLSLLRFIVTNK